MRSPLSQFQTPTTPRRVVGFFGSGCSTGCPAEPITQSSSNRLILLEPILSIVDSADVKLLGVHCQCRFSVQRVNKGDLLLTHIRRSRGVVKIGNDETNRELESAGGWNRRDLHPTSRRSIARVNSINRYSILRPWSATSDSVLCGLSGMCCCSSPMAGLMNRSLFAEASSLRMRHAARGHLAFSISADLLAAWRIRLRERGIEIESEVQWERGGTSLYFRDPDANLLELASPGVWPNY